MVNSKKILRNYSVKKDRTNYTRPEGAGNFDNMDDNNIVRSINIKNGTVDLAPVSDKQIVNKKYVDEHHTSLTAGSVVFSDSSNLTEDNSNLFWDDTNNRLGIGTASPTADLHILGKGIAGTTYPLKIADSDGESLFDIRDDSLVTYGHSNKGAAYRFVGKNGVSYTYDFSNRLGNYLSIKSNRAGATAFVIDSLGMVGIGTTSPDTKLQVVGDAKFGDDNTNFTSISSTGSITQTGSATISAGNGFTGTGAYTNFTIVGGIITAAS